MKTFPDNIREQIEAAGAVSPERIRLFSEALECASAKAGDAPDEITKTITLRGRSALLYHLLNETYRFMGLSEEDIASNIFRSGIEREMTKIAAIIGYVESNTEH